MQSLNLEPAFERFNQAACTLNPAFLTDSRVNAPILQQTELLLDAIGEKGIKLTAKGYLPVKVVEALAKCVPTLTESRYLPLAKRFIEMEQPAAMRTRVLCEIAKLTRVQKGILIPGKMAKSYRNAPVAERFIYLLHHYQHVNLAYFDQMQTCDLINHITPVTLQMIRDKQRLFREPEVLSALLFEAFPPLADEVDATVKPESLLQQDPYKTFEQLLEIRLLKNFFAPFGLIEEQGGKIDEPYAFVKTDLLDRLLAPLHAVDTEIVIDKRVIHGFTKRCSNEGLEVNLFHDFCYIYSLCAVFPLPSSESIADNMVTGRLLLGSMAERYKNFYNDFAKSVVHSLMQYTQLDKKGAGKNMTDGFDAWADALFRLLPQTTPFKLFESMQATTFFLMEILREHYRIDTMSENFFEACREHFNAEVAEDIGHFLLMMGELHKQTKKGTKIKSALKELTKHTISAYLLAVMSIYVFEMESS